MIEYILYGIIITYYVTFCSALAYVECKDRIEERRKLIRYYDNIRTEENMHVDPEFEHNHILYTISEEDETQSV